MNLDQLNARVNHLRAKAGQLRKIADKAEAAADKADENLLDAEWDRDDFIVQSWGEKPDLKVLLDSKSGGRFSAELKELLETNSGGTVSVFSVFTYSSQYVFSVHMNADEPMEAYGAVTGINFLLPAIDLNNPAAPGCAVFTLCHTQGSEFDYEIWVVPATGQAILVRYNENNDRTIAEKTTFNTLQALIEHAHKNLSYSY